MYNNSGEEYENAQVRLVVGTINLVEKIAQLAQVPMERSRRNSSCRKAQFRSYATCREGCSMRQQPPPAPASPRPALSRKQIIKEGLSEYFIYTIEGTETIPNGWSKRLRIVRSARPCRSRSSIATGRGVWRATGAHVPADQRQGIQAGHHAAARRHRSASSATTAATGSRSSRQQPIKYIPIGDKIELNLGPDPEVIFELIKLRAFRDNIWMQMNGADVFRRVDDGAAQDRSQLLGRRLGRSRDLRPAHPQLHRQADRGGGPPSV